MKERALHVNVADVAVKVLNDMFVNGSVERRQVAVTTSQLVQHSSICWVDWTHDDMYDNMDDHD